VSPARRPSAPEPVEVRLPIKDIVIGTRHRKHLADIEGFAARIKAVGLLHPVVVTPDRHLIAGERRILACSLLGWTDIPVTIRDLDDLLRAEADENTERLNFSPSEAVAIAAALRPAPGDQFACYGQCKCQMAGTQVDAALWCVVHLNDSGPGPATEPGAVRGPLRPEGSGFGRALLRV
jgi:hypothetical protein